jgi:hypothetical protein
LGIINPHPIPRIADNINSPEKELAKVRRIPNMPIITIPEPTITRGPKRSPNTPPGIELKIANKKGEVYILKNWAMLSDSSGIMTKEKGEVI